MVLHHFVVVWVRNVTKSLWHLNTQSAINDTFERFKRQSLVWVSMLQQAVSESKRNHLFPVWSFCLMLAVVRCELSLSCQNTCTFSMLLLFCYRLFCLQKIIQLAISFSPFQVWSWCFITGKKKRRKRSSWCTFVCGIPECTCRPFALFGPCHSKWSTILIVRLK